MGLKDEINSDISQFFREIDNMTPEDRRKTLLNLMDKYFHITQATVLFNKYDFQLIKSNAIKLYTDRAWPKKMRTGFNREIEGPDAANISLMESTILHLNSKDCLKKIPKFNYEE